jgi:hypothetical protein
MFFNLIQSSLEFVRANPMLVAMLMAITAYFKLFISAFAWAKAWMITLFAFILAFLFAIPAWPFAPSLAYFLNAILLGLAATGIYKTGAAIAEKAQDL